jgi:hypothetical protein
VENSFCVTADPCTQQKDCGAGYVCISSTCCTNFGYAPQLCLHYCEQGSQGQAPKLNVHKTAAHK